LVQRALRRRLLDPVRKPLALNRHDPLAEAADFRQMDAMVDMLWPASDPRAEEPAFIPDQASTFTAARPLYASNRVPNLAWA
jgi:hypothetical protein